jgi:hypothetical protein
VLLRERERSASTCTLVFLFHIFTGLCPADQRVFSLLALFNVCDVTAEDGTLAHPHSALLHLVGAQHQNFNDFSLLLGRLGRAMHLCGPVDSSAALSAIGDASASFLAGLCEVAPERQRSASDHYAALISATKGALLVRDDGATHTSVDSVQLPPTSADALQREEDVAHGDADEPGVATSTQH